MSQLRPLPSGNEPDAGLETRLRPQFAHPIILVDLNDPVIGGPQCLVGVCERLSVIFGKCSAHHQRWIDDGRPDDIEAWAQAAPANRRWLQHPPNARSRPVAAAAASTDSATPTPIAGTSRGAST